MRENTVAANDLDRADNHPSPANGLKKDRGGVEETRKPRLDEDSVILATVADVQNLC